MHNFVGTHESTFYEGGFYCHSIGCNPECNIGGDNNELICRHDIILLQSSGLLIVGKYLMSCLKMTTKHGHSEQHIILCAQ